MITPAGIWIQGFVDPQFKPAADAAMHLFPGVMIYTGNMNSDKWLEIGASGVWITSPAGSLIWECDTHDWWQIYYELREALIEYPPGWHEMMETKSIERKRKKIAEEAAYAAIFGELPEFHSEELVDSYV